LMLRRRNGEPVAYLTGHREFWSLDFLVTPGVLIPRPETEILVSAAVEAAKDCLAARNQPQTVCPWGVEIGVGSGAVAVSLARELPQLTWLALDLSAAALAVARDNARRHGVAERLHLVRGDLVAGLKSQPRFTLMVANLPYVPRAEWEQLPRDIKDYEPPAALLGGEDGLDLIRVLTRQAHLYLQPGGCLALEVGAGQAEIVLQLLRQTGAYLDKKDQKNLEILADYQGIQRVVRARRSLD
jgi:release factor glutamine methyltransferase